jgi:HEAT repeat protein
MGNQSVVTVNKKEAVLNRVVALICLFVMLCGCGHYLLAAAEGPAAPAAPADPDESARQLRIYADTLYQGGTEEVRVDAAIGLLVRQDADSRQVLLKALSGSDNPGVRTAVCRAMIRSRGLGSAAVPAEQFADPLIQVVCGTDEAAARLAAEALLIYRFSEIEGLLTPLVKDAGRDLLVRLHGIYALQLRTEPQALRILIQLLDDPNPEIQQGAERALQEAFGIPVGTGRAVWSAILEQLRQKSPEDIRRERLLRQEMRLRELQEERDRWQRLYLTALDNEYEAQDSAVRGKYLLERLNSDLQPIRIWALQKVVRLTGETDPALRERLLSLLSDTDRDVRLQTAQVLTTMSVLNPAEKLLEQYKKETDPKVSLALFEALGEACYFAFSPGSNITLPEQIPAEVLEIAVVYLRNEQPVTAKIGAEVIRKLLELTEIDSYQATVYLTALLERYQQAGAGTTLAASFQGDLLMIMARLASQGNHKTSASHLYKQAFAGAIADKDHPEIRLAGVTGLIGIDKAEALKICKEQNLVQDSSAAIREMLLDLAGQIGGREDLDWIAGQLSKNGTADSAWQAFRAICQRQNVDVCVAWAKQLEQQNGKPERVRQLWEISETKAQTENNSPLLEEIWSNLIRLYGESKEYAQILEVGKRIRAASGTSDYLYAIHPDLLRAALSIQQWAQAEILFKERLSRQDLDLSSPLFLMADEYIQNADIDIEVRRSFLAALEKIQSKPEHIKWIQILESWKEKLLSSQSVTDEQGKGEPNLPDTLK